MYYYYFFENPDLTFIDEKANTPVYGVLSLEL